MTNEPFLAGDTITRINIRMLSSSLRRVFPLPDDHRFDDLLQALDDTAADSPARG